MQTPLQVDVVEAKIKDRGSHRVILTPLARRWEARE